MLPSVITQRHTRLGQLGWAGEEVSLGSPQLVI